MLMAKMASTLYAMNNPSDEVKKAARKEYMRLYRLKNLDKWKRTPEQQAKVNARRRELYAQDEARRAKKRAEVKQWQQSNPQKRKGQRLKQHGIDINDYQWLMAEQSGKCAICGYSDQSNPNFFPVVDHCHTTGRVRGLLCMNCNQALGKFKDDPNLLMAAVAYLIRNNG